VRAAAAHAMALAQREARARGGYRTWDATDAAYLQILVDQAGYAPTDWELARLAAEQAGAGAPAGMEECRLLYDPVDQAWLLLADDDPIADHDGLPADADDAARQWAASVLAEEGLTPVGWTSRASTSADDAIEHVAELIDGEVTA